MNDQYIGAPLAGKFFGRQERPAEQQPAVVDQRRSTSLH